MQWPRYYVMRTLIGGEPDVNRRTIYRGSDQRPVWSRAPDALNGWSSEDEEALQAEMSRLMALPENPT